jgi:hypothetical protein
MGGVKDLAVNSLQTQLRTAKSVLGGDAHETYEQIDDFVTTLACGRATWVTSGRVELEGKA